MFAIHSLVDTKKAVNNGLHSAMRNCECTTITHCILPAMQSMELQQQYRQIRRRSKQCLPYTNNVPLMSLISVELNANSNISSETKSIRHAVLLIYNLN